MKTKTRPPRPAKRSRLQKRTESALQLLAQVELIRPVPEAEPAYLIKHALVQDTAQSTLLHGEYRRLNLLVAEAYESAFPNRRADDFAEVLAQHYAAGGDDENTLKYAMIAGDRAAQVYANAEAVEFYTLALESAKRGNATSEQLIHLYTKYGRVFEVMGSMNALTLYEEMTEDARSRGDRALELQSLLLRGKLHALPTAEFDPVRVHQLTSRANALAIELGDRKSQAYALWNEQMLYMFNNQFNDSIRVGEPAAEIARRVGDKELLAYIVGDLSRAYSLGGQVGKYQLLEGEALALWRELDNRPMVADMLMMSGSNAMRRGEFALAVRELEESVEISRTIGSKVSLLSGAGVLMIVRVEQGEFESALALLDTSLEAAKGLTGGIAGPLQMAYGAWVHASIGVFERATAFAEETRKRLASPTPDFFRAWSWAILARVSCELGDMTRARADLAQAGIASAGEIGSPATLNGVVALGECLFAEGDSMGLLNLMSAQIEWLKREGFHQTLPEAYMLMVQAAHALGQSKQAIDDLQRARKEAEAMQARPVLSRIYALLGEWERERGSPDAASAYFSQARAMVEYIAAHTPAEFRAAYLNRAPIRAILQTQ